MMRYSAAVWSHFAHPRNAGRWPAGETGIFTGRAVTPASDAVLCLHLRIAEGQVREARFQAHGCVSTIAAGSWLSDWVTGLDVRTARTLSAADIAAALDLAAEKRHCALLAEDALRAALEDGSDHP